MSRIGKAAWLRISSRQSDIYTAGVYSLLLLGSGEEGEAMRSIAGVDEGGLASEWRLERPSAAAILFETTNTVA